MTLSALDCLIPSIMEAWLLASDRMTTFGILDPRVDSVVQLETYPDVNNNADSLPCRSAISLSSSK